MREIRSHTGGVDDIVEGKLVNEGRSLQQEGKRLYLGLVVFDLRLMPTDLANATRGSENNYRRISKARYMGS